MSDHTKRTFFRIDLQIRKRCIERTGRDSEEASLPPVAYAQKSIRSPSVCDRLDGTPGDLTAPAITYSHLDLSLPIRDCQTLHGSPIENAIGLEILHQQRSKSRNWLESNDTMAVLTERHGRRPDIRADLDDGGAAPRRAPRRHPGQQWFEFVGLVATIRQHVSKDQIAGGHVPGRFIVTEAHHHLFIPK